MDMLFSFEPKIASGKGEALCSGKFFKSYDIHERDWETIIILNVLS